MDIAGWNDPAEEERNPWRAEERRRAREELEGRLRERRVSLSGSETDEDVVAIINAVEDFEARISRLGADTFVNTPESSQPDDRRLVLPARRDDEAPERYVARVREAARNMD